MSIDKSFIRILTSVVLTAVLGLGAVSVSAEPDEETGDYTYTDQETYEDPGTDNTDDYTDDGTGNDTGDGTGDDDTDDDTGDYTEDPDVGDTDDDTGYDDGNDDGTTDDTDGDNTDYDSDDDTGDDVSDSDSYDNDYDYDYDDDYSEDDYSEEYEESDYDYWYEEDQPWEYYTTEDDDDGYYYDYDAAYEAVTPETDTSALDNSDAEYSDGDVLTAEDWEKLRNETGDPSETSQASSFELNVAQAGGKEVEAISKLKEESTQGNDDWIYLALGIALVSLAAVTVTVIIITTVVSKKRLKQAAFAQGTQKRKPEPKYGAPVKSKTSKKKQKNKIVNSKTDTSEIDLGKASEKPGKKR